MWTYRQIVKFRRNILLPFSGLNMEAVFSSKTLVSTYQSTGVAAQKNNIDIFTAVNISNHKRLIFVRSRGESEVKILSPIMMYSATVVGLVTAGTLLMMNDRYWRIVDQTSSFGDNVLEAANIIFFLPVILVPFTHWYECGKKARFVNNWRMIQVRTRDTGNVKITKTKEGERRKE
jgi:hypothetical protein